MGSKSQFSGIRNVPIISLIYNGFKLFQIICSFIKPICSNVFLNHEEFTLNLYFMLF